MIIKYTAKGHKIHNTIKINPTKYLKRLNSNKVSGIFSNIYLINFIN